MNDWHGEERRRSVKETYTAKEINWLLGVLGTLITALIIGFFASNTAHLNMLDSRTQDLTLIKYRLDQLETIAKTNETKLDAMLEAQRLANMQAATKR